MEGLELSVQELAYLLTLVRASGLPGVTDPRLFPETPTTQKNTYSKGRELLEAHGWVTEVADHKGEYEVNSWLFGMVATLADPEVVVVTFREDQKGRRQVVLHYLGGEQIVELFAASKTSYRMGLVLGIEMLQGRLAQMLEVSDAAHRGLFTLEEATFKKVRSLSEGGQPDKAGKLLSNSGLNGAAGASLLQALSAPARGQLVVARQEGGQIVAGRRTQVYGGSDTAWMALRTTAGSSEVQVSACDASGLGVLVDAWVEQMTAKPQGM
ncbi:MAG TPA: hypothetical protein VI410_02130 [Anaerolineales bacterium]|nr:hypothetical protein [Anaerolineales bacterium]